MSQSSPGFAKQEFIEIARSGNKPTLTLINKIEMFILLLFVLNLNYRFLTI